MNNYPKIAILRLGTIGDLILSTPMFSLIKENYPNASISVIVGNRNKFVLESNPNVDKLIIWRKSLFCLPKVINEFRSTQFDFYIDPKDHFSRESLIISQLINSRIKIGLNPRGKSCFNYSIPSYEENTGLHFTQIVINSLSYLNIFLKDKNNIPKPQLFISKESKTYVENFCQVNNCKEKNYIVINLSASNPKKMIPADKLIESLLNSELNSTNLSKILTFTKNHQKFAFLIKKRIPWINLFPSRSFNDIVALIYNAKAVITPDTSIVHICSAFETPLLAFYSGLDDFYAKFRPLNPNSFVLRANPGEDGLNSISVHQIIYSINKFIKNFVEVL